MWWYHDKNLLCNRKTLRILSFETWNCFLTLTALAFSEPINIFSVSHFEMEVFSQCFIRVLKYFDLVVVVDLSYLWKRTGTLNTSAWSVLTETEKPTVLSQFFRTKTVWKPILLNTLEPEPIKNRYLELLKPESKPEPSFRTAITGRFSNVCFTPFTAPKTHWRPFWAPSIALNWQ